MLKHRPRLYKRVAERDTESRGVFLLSFDWTHSGLPRLWGGRGNEVVMLLLLLRFRGGGEHDESVVEGGGTPFLVGEVLVVAGAWGVGTVVAGTWGWVDGVWSRLVVLLRVTELRAFCCCVITLIIIFDAFLKQPAASAHLPDSSSSTPLLLRAAGDNDLIVVDDMVKLWSCLRVMGGEGEIESVLNLCVEWDVCKWVVSWWFFRDSQRMTHRTWFLLTVMACWLAGWLGLRRNDEITTGVSPSQPFHLIRSLFRNDLLGQQPS